MQCPPDYCRRCDGELCADDVCAIADGSYTGPLGPLPGERPSYAAHRAQRMWMAHDYEGWDRAPYPYLSQARSIGRVFILPFHWMGRKLRGLVPHSSLLDAEFKAREKRQNREKFS